MPLLPNEKVFLRLLLFCTSFSFKYRNLLNNTAIYFLKFTPNLNKEITNNINVMSLKCERLLLLPPPSLWCFIYPSADGTVDSGQGSSVFTESRVSSQQTVSYGSQHEQAHSTGTAPGHTASSVQTQSQPHGVYPPSSMVSKCIRKRNIKTIANG